VSVEALRVEHTYELLIGATCAEGAKEGSRPQLWSQVLFRVGRATPLDLVEKDRSVAGKIAPEFFTRGGEARQLPGQVREAIQAVVAGTNCAACSTRTFSLSLAGGATGGYRSNRN